jgi:thiol-disulfide isomerase/thioredoxin
VPDTLRFAATTVDGKPFDGASLAGQPTLLWFWAPWCPTCRGQIPQVQELAKTYTGEVQVIGVGSQDDRSAIENFAIEAAGPTHLSDERGEVWKHFGVVEQSSFILLDAGGTKVFSTGYGGSDQLADRVAELAG